MDFKCKEKYLNGQPVPIATEELASVCMTTADRIHFMSDAFKELFSDCDIV